MEAAVHHTAGDYAHKSWLYHPVYIFASTSRITNEVSTFLSFSLSHPTFRGYYVHDISNFTRCDVYLLAGQQIQNL